MHLFHKTNIDFLRWRWHAVILSWVVILAGLGVIATQGLQIGIEFAGGTAVIAEFDQTPSIDAVRERSTSNYPERRPRRDRPELRRSGSAPGDGARAAGRD